MIRSSRSKSPTTNPATRPGLEKNESDLADNGVAEGVAEIEGEEGDCVGCDITIVLNPPIVVTTVTLGIFGDALLVGLGAAVMVVDGDVLDGVWFWEVDLVAGVSVIITVVAEPGAVTVEMIGTEEVGLTVESAPLVPKGLFGNLR
jgi:hypothetical protein